LPKLEARSPVGGLGRDTPGGSNTVPRAQRLENGAGMYPRRAGRFRRRLRSLRTADFKGISDGSDFGTLTAEHGWISEESGRFCRYDLRTRHALEGHKKCQLVPV
jgi:hypothetical protein